MIKYIKGSVAVASFLGFCFLLTTLRTVYASLLLEGAIFIISLIALLKVADIFTEISTTLGNILGLSRLATGVLIISIGTSAPELFASIGAALQQQPDIVIGNILGTVVANSFLGIGFGVLAAGGILIVHKDVFGTQMSIFLATILLLLGSLYDGILSAFEGIILVVMLGLYLRYVIRNSTNLDEVKNKTDQSAIISKCPVIALVILLIMSLAALFLSGDFVVTSLIGCATYLNLSSAKLATSVLAVGTSIPEIATAIALVKRKNADGLFGEIIGSNIFDILGVLGVISIFTPLSMEKELLRYLGGAIFFTFLIINVIMNDRKINKIEGVFLIALFAIFTMQLLSFNCL